MTLEIRSPKDFWAGVLYLGIGIAAFWIARDYSMGSAGRMGPGYFPTFISGGLIVIGLLSLLRSFVVHGEPIRQLALKQLAIISFAMILFGLIVRGAGTIVALPLLAVISASASYYFRVVPMVLVALAVTLFCILVFFKALGLPLPIFGSWWGG